MNDAVAVRLSEAGAALDAAVTDESLRPHIKLVREIADSQLLLSFPHNPSGLTPIEFKVLILPDPVEEVTKGGIIRPVETVDKDKYATMQGTVIAVSPLAFTYASQEEWDAAGAEKPKPGDHVHYAKYAGVLVKSKKDGKEYLVVNDKDLCLKIED